MPGGGVVPGGRPAYGLVRNEASEVIDAIGSRRVGSRPRELRFGVRSVWEAPLPLRVRLWPLSCRGERGVGLVAVVGPAGMLA